MGREGFALLSVLLVIAAAATICLSIALAEATAGDAGRNRLDAERAYWSARSCLADLLHEADVALARAADQPSRSIVWRALPDALARRPGTSTDCRMQVDATGIALDVNTATEERLIALFAACGLGSARVDLAHSLLDWIDADDDVRPEGAERSDYVALRRIPPRNGPLADARELSHILGFERAADELRPFIRTTPGRISLSHAPAEVLATLPGFSPEVIARLLERRRSRSPISDLRELLDIVSVQAAEGISERFPELVQLAVAAPESWMATLSARVGSPPVEVTIGAELVRAGDGTAVARWVVQ